MEDNNKDFAPSAKVLNFAKFEGTSLDDALITFELTFHRWILAEVNTYRKGIAKNTASSRAIPLNKMIQLVNSAKLYPVEWPKNQSGMSASELINEDTQKDCRQVWNEAKHSALIHAAALGVLGVHKQVVNRLLEPFIPVTCIATMQYSTFSHIFKQRTDAAAQPEFRELAWAMFRAIPHKPEKMNPLTQVYLPYGGIQFTENVLDSIVPRIQIGRAARTSYLRQDEKDIDKNLNIFYRLAADKHLSPFEHVVMSNEARFPLAQKIFPLDFRNPISTFNNCFTFRNFIETGVEFQEIKPDYEYTDGDTEDKLNERS